MAERAVAENLDQQVNLDFNQGFDEGNAPPATPAQATPATEPPKTEAKTPAKESAPQAPAKVEKPAAPEYVQLTKEDHQTLMAAAAKTASFDGQFSKLFGTIGNVQQVIEKLRTQTPAGEKVEVPKASFAKLREAFPEVADLLEADMTEALKGVRGTGQAEAPGATLTAEDIQKMSKASVVALQIEALEEEHPNWRQVVGSVDSEGKHDPNNEFRKWLVTQPVEYQTKINGTDSALVISKAIDKFNASKAPATPSVPAVPTPKAAAQKSRIEGAVQPKGDGGQPPPAKTDRDEFQAGFESG